MEDFNNKSYNSLQKKTYNIFQDWKINEGNIKGRIVLVLYRLASLIRSKKILVIFFFWYLLFYRIFVEWFLNIEIHWNSKIGKGLRLEHGHGTVIHGDATLGNYCTIRHLTTIGIIKHDDGSYSHTPQLGNNVDVGASVTIIGGVNIGDNVLIGAASLVVRDIPANTTALGNPARVVKRHEVAEVSKQISYVVE
ncbi:serine acetyltransferase [Pedobacter lithocola]|uniref:Serine acetyltransferase n=1 Tax=Pedobacter lithocola TaxID=1908239 RepID=A0ABV8P565_9SPHI